MSAPLDPCAPLNRRQQAIADEIVAFQREHRRIPSRRELAKRLGRKPGGYLDRVVVKLRTKGMLPRR